MGDPSIFLYLTNSHQNANELHTWDADENQMSRSFPGPAILTANAKCLTRTAGYCCRERSCRIWFLYHLDSERVAPSADPSSWAVWQFVWASSMTNVGSCSYAPVFAGSHHKRQTIPKCLAQLHAWSCSDQLFSLSLPAGPFLETYSGNLSPSAEKAASLSSRFRRVSSFLALMIHQ